MEQEKLTMYHGIKDAAKNMGLSIDLLRRARAHPDCPHSTKGGFADSGRVYVSKDFEKWLAEHKKELLTVEPGTLEHWNLLRLKYQTLALEAELAEKQSKVVNREDAIASYDKIAEAFKALINGRFRTQMIEGLKLNPDQISDLDAALAAINGVWDTQRAAFKK
jgi:hypothetical protein